MKQLVYFSAPWCQPCKMFGPVVDAFVNDNEIQLIKVNIDENPELAIENNITSIPVLVLLDGDDELYRLTGAKPRPFLDKVLQDLI